MRTDSRPRLCFLAPNAFPLLANEQDIRFAGGAELQQVTLAKGLVGRGYDVSMICHDYGQDDRVNIEGITVYRAFEPTAGLPLIRFLWPRLTSVWRCMSQANADVYYQRAGSMLTGVMAYHCWLKGKRSIFAAAGEPKIRFSRDRRIYEYGVRRVDQVLVQNEMQKRHFLERFGRESILIPNSISVDETYGHRNPVNILWVGTIRSVKRPERLLNIAKALPDYRFTMVGGPSHGENRLYEEIERRARDMPNVDFKGFVPYSMVGQYFDQAAILLNTSDSEGFPNTFLQAWSRSIPTISFVDCGARSSSQHVGVVVSSDAEMSLAVESLMRSPEKRRALGALCKAYALENHGIDHVLDLFEGVINTLAAGGQLARQR